MQAPGRHRPVRSALSSANLRTGRQRTTASQDTLRIRDALTAETLSLSATFHGAAHLRVIACTHAAIRPCEAPGLRRHKALRCGDLPVRWALPQVFCSDNGAGSQRTTDSNEGLTTRLNRHTKKHVPRYKSRTRRKEACLVPEGVDSVEALGPDQLFPVQTVSVC
jgi:hypothetical protein